MGGVKREWEQMLEADPDYPSPDSDWWKQQDLEREEIESDE